MEVVKNVIGMVVALGGLAIGLLTLATHPFRDVLMVLGAMGLLFHSVAKLSLLPDSVDPISRQ